MKVGARFYDPIIGRWIQKAPILDGFNWWVYCENDPVNGVDPEGTWTKVIKRPFNLLRSSRSKVIHDKSTTSLRAGRR
ncbi:hypothetical protein H5T87_01230 [bacterium]|nr:hypothetical protein [bacterium]